MTNGNAKIGPHGKVFRDAVHGLIRIEPEDSFLLDLINTSEFQRLRRVRQLGVSSLTYPGAEHSRFAHSLGVLCLAQRILITLRHRYRKDSAATDLLDAHEQTVKAAALLHDIGHAPFSHMMERAFGATAKLPERTPEVAKRFFTSEGKLSHADFLMCDEATLISAMQVWCLCSTSEHERLAELAGCFLWRQKAFFCRDLAGAKVGQLVKLSEALNDVGQKNLDWVLDDLDFNSYRDFDSIFRAGTPDKEGQEEAASTEAILLADGPLGSSSRPVEGPSVILRALGDNSRHSIFRLYYHRRVAAPVEKLLAQLQLNHA